MKYISLLVCFVLFTTFGYSQNDSWADKSLDELLLIFKEKVETHGNMLNGGVKYEVSSSFGPNGEIQIAENISGLDWFDINLNKATFGTNVNISATGKDNFFLRFDNSITIRRKNNKAKNLDVAFFKKKDKRDTDFSVLISDLTQLLTIMISKSKG